MDWNLIIATTSGAAIAIVGTLLQSLVAERSRRSEVRQQRLDRLEETARLSSTAVIEAANALVAQARSDGTHPTSSDSEELFAKFRHACDVASLYVDTKVLAPLDDYRFKLVVWVNQVFDTKDTKLRSPEQAAASEALIEFRNEVRSTHTRPTL
ncbi:hypothetical protein [Brachybacterium sp. GU-2]|uniref:hypothetical protein n=1 Tax=Brachybacterium sp. GU-2 TaxID=3069708 RepID=UPI00280C0B50|nr:hypothetical protein [Brachybacterium sp. GU-2]WME23273.1 hypothetical protein RBL05_00555 [Brachybacterium sp. GU-2]